MRNGRGGFTLVELAIVLIIIGIIMGAVLKGQDLIRGAQGKKLTSLVKSWEVASFGYYDIYGNYPNELDDILQSELKNKPDSSINLGGSTFYVKIGSDASNTLGNVIVLCVTNDCTGTFTSDQLFFAKSVDNSLDGKANGTTGDVLGATGITLGNGDIATTTNDAVTDVTGEGTDLNTSITALVYYYSY
ncbi:prepilin-type N-terminal cleavage/methylation domain-containing protein [Nitrosophilus alvini]|uniref:prepilin-type N-terminal cleavage/methylation domain-containing protein n=1 Tax=Nitrosophilus alvini TaxID=2714855 RepID=UPI00190C774C|nr:prepilin-type N-terminal cleavage/methylation domain-containing protein [Nitrosophilus alvini]